MHNSTIVVSDGRIELAPDRMLTKRKHKMLAIIMEDAIRRAVLDIPSQPVHDLFICQTSVPGHHPELLNLAIGGDPPCPLSTPKLPLV